VWAPPVGLPCAGVCVVFCGTADAPVELAPDELDWLVFCAHREALIPANRSPATSNRTKIQYNFFTLFLWPRMSDPDPRVAAAEYFRQAYELQTSGEYARALVLYTRSIATFPTAEAYTFRGWTYSFVGDYESAIEDCRRAIKVDPEFGNPYNDIGAYLIEQGKWSESIPWFEKAIAAKRYEARSYPHFNLGRVYEHQGKWIHARRCYRQAFELDHHYRNALFALRRLSAMLN